MFGLAGTLILHYNTIDCDKNSFWSWFVCLKSPNAGINPQVCFFLDKLG